MFELGRGKFVVDQVADDRQVGKADVALVGTRMHRQPAGAGGKGDSAEGFDARPRQVAPVAKHGDGVEVHGELGGHGGHPSVTKREALLLSQVLRDGQRDSQMDAMPIADESPSISARQRPRAYRKQYFASPFETTARRYRAAHVFPRSGTQTPREMPSRCYPI